MLAGGGPFSDISEARDAVKELELGVGQSKVVAIEMASKRSKCRRPTGGTKMAVENIAKISRERSQR